MAISASDTGKGYGGFEGFFVLYGTLPSLTLAPQKLEAAQIPMHGLGDQAARPLRVVSHFGNIERGRRFLRPISGPSIVALSLNAQPPADLTGTPIDVPGWDSRICSRPPTQTVDSRAPEYHRHF